MSELTPTLLHGRYEVLAVVGRGGEGTLVRAVDRRHSRDVALKLRRVPGDPRDAERLLTEARTLLSLHPHPYLPLARDDFFEGDRHVLVMDWVDGVDLGAVLAEHGQPGLPPSTVLRWLAPVSEALTHLHNIDPPVVHGDVKPANLVLTPTGRVVLVDFGVSSTRGFRPRGGTPGYRAPEVAGGELPTRAADVYGLAATAFALLTGQPPSGILPTWNDIDDRRAAQLERALRRGLATDPAQRTSTPGELVEELRAGWDCEPLPTGVVTFLATDVVSSTRLWHESPDAAPGLLAEHLLVVDRAVERHGGRRIGDAIQGDSTMSVFHRAGDAVGAGVELQRALAGGRVQVHCGVHTGEVLTVDDNFAGATLSRVARVRALGEGGQVLLSATTARLVSGNLPSDVGLIDLGPHRLDGFDQPEAVFAVDTPGLAVPPDPSRPPYRGLVPYDVDDQAFFGRDREIDVCLQKVADSGILAVVGPSGCGKSSLVRAGVASRLRRAGQSVAVLTPGSDPHAAWVAAVEAAGPTTVLIVDQLEDIFAPDVASGAAQQLLDDLVERLDVAPVVVDLRADHVGSVTAHPSFARRLEAGLHLVTPMTESELRDVIEGPAQHAGLSLEPGLVELLLRDVSHEPGALPLLSFALAETWSNRDGRTLTVDGYLATGGLRQAIAVSAERLYEGLADQPTAAGPGALPATGHPRTGRRGCAAAHRPDLGPHRRRPPPSRGRVRDATAWSSPETTAWSWPTRRWYESGRGWVVGSTRIAKGSGCSATSARRRTSGTAEGGIRPNCSAEPVSPRPSSGSKHPTPRSTRSSAATSMRAAAPKKSSSEQPTNGRSATPAASAACGPCWRPLPCFSSPSCSPDWWPSVSGIGPTALPRSPRPAGSARKHGWSTTTTRHCSSPWKAGTSRIRARPGSTCSTPSSAAPTPSASSEVRHSRSSTSGSRRTASPWSPAETGRRPAWSSTTWQRERRQRPSPAGRKPLQRGQPGRSARGHDRPHRRQLRASPRRRGDVQGRRPATGGPRPSDDPHLVQPRRPVHRRRHGQRPVRGRRSGADRVRMGRRQGGQAGPRVPLLSGLSAARPGLSS